MATITTIQSTDLITNSRSTINTNFANLNTDKIETSVLDTDTTLAANSDSKIASQKATKAYTDSVAGTLASETVKGNVEEAITGEITAGTDTGTTGAKLFVPPSKMNTQIDAKITAAELARVPFFEQDLAVSTNDAVSGADFAFGSNTTGSVFYIIIQGASLIYRFERDSLTGSYLQTHTVDPTPTLPSADLGAIIVIGSYMYYFLNDATNIICRRYLAADLTDEQTMTVPTVACTSGVVAWTNGTDAYVTSNDSNTTTRRWTVSGTTFSAAATSTTASIIDADKSSMWDGTTAYLGSFNGSPFTIQKLTNIDGSSKTTTTKLLPTTYSDVQDGGIILNIDTTKIYVGFLYAYYDEAAQVSARVHLIPISKP